MTKELKQLDLFECSEVSLECSKCGGYKPCSEFYKDKNTKRGYLTWCKMCVKEYQKQYRKDNSEYYKQKNKQYYDDNVEYYKQYNKQYQIDNVEQIKQKNKQWREDNVEYDKEYREKNAEHIKQWNKQYYTSPYKADDTAQTLKDIKIYESYEIDKDGDVNFKCVYCGIFFKTTRREVQHRLDSINNICNGERRFYCSDQCKEECPTYNQTLYPKGHKPAASSREVQPQLRQMVLARDNYTCQKCGWHKDDLSVGLHCHHIWPLNESPITSADIDECITYCKDCHTNIHKTVLGCGYGEMRCSIEDKMLV